MPSSARLNSLAKLFNVGVDDILSGDAISPTNTTQKEKAKRHVIKFSLIAILVATIGLLLLLFKDTAIIQKTDISYEGAQKIIRETEERWQNDENAEGFFIYSSWDTADGSICMIDADYSVCFRKNPNNSQVVTEEYKSSITHLFIIWSVLLFIASAYVVTYAIVKYKFGRYAWYVTQIYIFLAMFVILTTATIIANLTNFHYIDLGWLLYYALCMAPAIMLSGDGFPYLIGPGGLILFYAIIMLIGISYPLINILVQGKRNLNK